jgi:hypothetical protein
MSGKFDTTRLQRLLSSSQISDSRLFEYFDRSGRTSVRSEGLVVEAAAMPRKVVPSWRNAPFSHAGIDEACPA